MRFLQFTDEDGQPILIRDDVVVTVKAFDPGSGDEYAHCHSEINFSAGGNGFLHCIYVRESIDLVVSICTAGQAQRYDYGSSISASAAELGLGDTHDSPQRDQTQRGGG